MENILNTAYNLINNDLSENEIIKITEQGNDLEKAAAFLKIKTIGNKKIADLLISHLTNQHGQIREICAYKINELIKDFPQYFQDKYALDKIIAALNDVNPNIVRYILEILGFIENKEYIFDNLLNKITDLKNDILNKPRRGKKEEHIFTKKCFKIYWALESIKMLISLKYDIIKHDKDKFLNIIRELSNFEEYTIREKIAKIVLLTDFEELSDIKNNIENDKNFFVNHHAKRGKINENFISR